MRASHILQFKNQLTSSINLTKPSKEVSYAYAGMDGMGQAARIWNYRCHSGSGSDYLCGSQAKITVLQRVSFSLST